MQTILFLAVALCAVLANVCVQMASHRWSVGKNLVRSLVYGFLAGIFVCVVGCAFIISVPKSSTVFLWQDTMAVVLIYLAGSFTFLCFVAAGETSVRFQILRELRRAESGLTLAELDAVYSNRILLRTRLERLVESKTVTIVAGRYHLSSRQILVVAWSFLTCRVILFGVLTEFRQSSKAETS
jgi:hypothetical protein